MAITIYKYDDVGVPNLSAEPNGQSLQALLEYVLPLHGWTIVHDTTRRGTGTSTDGRIIFERPDADFVFWMDNEGSTDFVVGLAVAGFPDGSLSNPQSHKGQPGSATELQKVDDNGSSNWQRWVAHYDDASDTLIYKASLLSYAGHGQSASAQPWGYLGTLAKPAFVPYEIPALYMGEGTLYATGAKHGLSAEKGTTLVQYDGSPASGETYLLNGSGFSGLTPTLSTIASNGGPAFPYIPLTKLGVSCSSPITGGNNNNLVEVGVLRGCLVCASVGSSSSSQFFQINFPTEYAGNSFDNPIVIGGTTYYTSSVNVIAFVSDDPDDWVF